MLFFLIDILTIVDENLFSMQICSFVCLLETLQVRYPHQKCENFNTLSQFSHRLLQGFLSYHAYMYWATSRLPCVIIRPGSFLIFI